MSSVEIPAEHVHSASLPAELDLTKILPLDENSYSADEEFLSTVTGIKDRAELKKHVLSVQAEAYAVYPYPCIRNFAISQTKINRYPAYRHLLELGKERKGAIFLEAGCCVGNDIRRAVLDGYPAKQIVGTDLNPGFWDIGHRLFKSTSDTFPVKFLPGNIFETEFLNTQATPKVQAPDLSALTTLTPLVGHVSAIHASSFFHLFDEDRQLRLAHIFNALLSPEPGSIAFGAHGGLPEKGLRVGTLNSSGAARQLMMFCHSPESWKEMWEGVVGKGKAVINATLERAPDRKDCVWSGANRERFWLVWSVQRL